MDAEDVAGLAVAAAWLGLFLYLPVAGVRRAGSLQSWLQECARTPVMSLAAAAVAIACCTLLAWLLTGGWMPSRVPWLVLFVILVLVVAGTRRQ